MSCSCGHPNPAGARFCGGCGAALASAPACARCGTPNPPGHSFCNGCGKPLADEASPRDPRTYTPAHLAEKILGSRAIVEGERKHITVLFCDVKGSLDLSNSLDPEAWHRVMDRFFEILTTGVHRFEGTVNQYTGDGIMALFGAPIGHEDHPQRACWTALWLREAIGDYARMLRRDEGLSFSVRMGMNSGEVVVGAIGDDLRMDYTAIGRTVGLAQRMEQLAEPGAVYLTEATAALAGGYFDLDDLGSFDVKGVPEPLRVFSLRGAGRHRTRLDEARARGFSRFVGRTDEIGVLRDALRDAAEGRGCVVDVVGEAGLGKSRLCLEFAREMRAAGIRVFEAHGVAHGRAMPFLPILELLRAYFGIEDTDTPVEARQKIAGSLLLLDETFRDGLPLAFDFLGVPDPDLPAPQPDAAARMMQLFGLVGHLIRARSARGPAVVVIEDLHWLDDGSRAFVEHLVDAVPHTRTLLVANRRPDYHPPWTSRPHYRRLALRPLGPDAVDELLADRLGEDTSVEGLHRMIRERTGGNPFFVEEVVRTLVESGALAGEKGAYTLAAPVADVKIPPTVQAVLAARIDRLAEREKAVLSTAAVIGREFAEPVLRQVTGLGPLELEVALRPLVGGEFLFEQSLYPETEYAFTHPLTQEVAYRTQLADRRRTTHAAIAQAMEQLYEDGSGERAPLLAHHWDQAGDAVQAARWARRAAEWTGHSDPKAALRHWRRVRELLPSVPASTERDALALASCIGIMNLGAREGLSEAQAASLFDEGRRLAVAADDRRSEARLLLVYARLRGQAGEIEEAVAHSHDAATLAEDAGWSGLRLAAAVGLSAWYWQLGDLPRSLQVIEEAIRAVPGDLGVGAEHLGYSPYIWLVMNRGRLLPWLGRCAEAAEACDRAIELATEHSEREILVWAHQGHVDCAWLSGDATLAMPHARAAAELAERLGTALVRWSSAYSLGRAHLLSGDPAAARSALEESLGIIRDTRTGLHGEILVLGALAEAHLGSGNLERASARATEAVELSRRDRQRPGGIAARIVLARVLVRTGDAGGAKLCIDEATQMLGAETTPMLEPFVRVQRAEVALASGDAEGHDRELAAARELFIRMGAGTRAEQLERSPAGG